MAADSAVLFLEINLFLPLDNAPHDIVMPNDSLLDASPICLLPASLPDVAGAPVDQLQRHLWRGEDVEGRGHREASLKIADPEFGPRKLPLPEQKEKYYTLYPLNNSSPWSLGSKANSSRLLPIPSHDGTCI